VLHDRSCRCRRRAGYFDRGKIALPDGAAADAASVDIVIVDGTAEFCAAP
jgi:hypothetical protein